MIRLNLGCGNPNDRSWHPMEGWINRDPALDGWRFEDGLGDYANGSVEAISISHASMYLPLDLWPAFMAECARVLCDGGVLRITEDDCFDTRSRNYPDGWKGSAPRVTLTGPAMVKEHMRLAGLVAFDCDATQTHFADPSIMQDQHGGAPHCFYCEGVRMTRALFTAHSDDEVLFASFVILKYRPQIIVCCPSVRDYGTTETRIAESREAGTVLGAQSVDQWDGIDIAERMRQYDAEQRPSLVFAPNERTSHPDHLLVARAAREVFGDRLRTYHTYDEQGKVHSEWRIEYEPAWVYQKLRALTRFPSQAMHPRAGTFFMQDHFEYWGERP